MQESLLKGNQMEYNVKFVGITCFVFCFLIWCYYIVSEHENKRINKTYDKKSSKIIRMRVELCVLMLLIFCLLKSFILFGSGLAILTISVIAIKKDFSNNKKISEHKIIKKYLNYLILSLMIYCIANPISSILNDIFIYNFIIKLVIGFVLGVPMDYMYQEKLKPFIQKSKKNLGIDYSSKGVDVIFL